MGKWYDDKRKQVAIREYKSQKEMEKDAEKAIAHGWQLSTTTDRAQRVGVARVATMGVGALFFKPKAKLMVTYTRTTE